MVINDFQYIAKECNKTHVYEQYSNINLNSQYLFYFLRIGSRDWNLMDGNESDR